MKYKNMKANTVVDLQKKEFKCVECEGVFKLILPIKIEHFVIQGKAFDELHKLCAYNV